MKNENVIFRVAEPFRYNNYIKVQKERSQRGDGSKLREANFFEM